MAYQLLQLIIPNGVSDDHELCVSHALAENVNVSVAAVSEKGASAAGTREEMSNCN